MPRQPAGLDSALKGRGERVGEGTGNERSRRLLRCERQRASPRGCSRGKGLGPSPSMRGRGHAPRPRKAQRREALQIRAEGGVSRRRREARTNACVCPKPPRTKPRESSACASPSRGSPSADAVRARVPFGLPADRRARTWPYPTSRSVCAHLGAVWPTHFTRPDRRRGAAPGDPRTGPTRWGRDPYGSAATEVAPVLPSPVPCGPDCESAPSGCHLSAPPVPVSRARDNLGFGRNATGTPAYSARSVLRPTEASHGLSP